MLCTLAICLKNVNRENEAEAMISRALALPGLEKNQVLKGRLEELEGP